MLARLKWNHSIYNSLRNFKGCYMFGENSQPQSNTNKMTKLSRKKVND